MKKGFFFIAICVAMALGGVLSVSGEQSTSFISYSTCGGRTAYLNYEDWVSWWLDSYIEKTTVDYCGGHIGALGIHETWLPTWYTSMHKQFVVWDTRNVPSDANLISGTIQAEIGSVNVCETASNRWVGWTYSSQVATNTAAWITDYANTSTLMYTDTLDTADFSAFATTTWVLTQAGLNAIEKGGYTKMMMRTRQDVERVNPPICQYQQIEWLSPFNPPPYTREPILTLNYSVGAYMNITSPESGASTSSNFTLAISYDTKSEGWNRIMVFFDNTGGTCYHDEEYIGGLPFFSPTLGVSGTTAISVENLAMGVYDCVRCFFINETAGTNSLEMCPAYTLSVSSYEYPTSTPSYYFPVQNWANYYASNSDKWSTSTGLFSGLAGLISPIMIWIGNIGVSFQGIFSATSSFAKGQELGAAIPTARGYLQIIDNFFGGLPISSVFLFYIITALILVIFKLITAFVHLIKP